MNTKKCTRCLEVKQLDKFAKNARNKTDGRQPKCKECNKAYYLANQDRIKARVAKDYFDNHKAKLVRRRELASRPETKKKKAEQNKRYSSANKEKLANYYRQWAAENRDYLRAYNNWWRHKRKAWILNNGNNTLTKEQIVLLFRDHPYCEYCKAVESLTLDHVVPVSRGGQNCIENITIACQTCNSNKNNKLLSEWKHTT